MLNFPTYLISLAEVKERRVSSMAQMDSVFGSGNYEVVDAFYTKTFIKCGVDSWHMDPSHPVAKRIEREFDKPITEIIQPEKMKQWNWLYRNAGGPGCILSHGLVWSKFLASGASVAYISEDDVLFEPDVQTSEFEEIAEILEQISYPTIILGYHHENQKVYMAREPAIPLSRRKMYNPNNPKNVTCTVGYFINRAAAKNLYQNLLPLSFLPDLFGHFKEKGWIDELWCVRPFMLSESGQETTLSIEYSGEDVRHTSKIRAALHEVAQLALDWKVPVASHLIQRRRQKMCEGGTVWV